MDPKHLRALEKAVGSDEGYTTYLPGNYLVKKVGTGEAKQLAQTWEKQRAAEAARAKQKTGTKPDKDP